MPAEFREGFFVREAAWHNSGIVLDEVPDRAEAMRLAGHDFEIEKHPLYTPQHGKVPKFVALARHYPDRSHELEGEVLHCATQGYGILDNSVMWDFTEAVAGEGAKYDAAVTLGESGAELALTMYLDEPTTVPGDNSPLLPFCVGTWNHDGSGKGRVLATSIRVVCRNTNMAAQGQAEGYNTLFEFTHSKNVLDYVAAARETVQGMRAETAAYVDMATELGNVKVTEDQRELFLTEFVPMPMDAQVSDRVVKNIDEARAAIRSIMDGETVPDAHRLTGYGLHLAGVEFLDHVRPWRSPHSYTRRTLLKPDKAKARLTDLIMEVAKA